MSNLVRFIVLKDVRFSGSENIYLRQGLILELPMNVPALTSPLVMRGFLRRLRGSEKTPVIKPFKSPLVDLIMQEPAAMSHAAIGRKLDCSTEYVRQVRKRAAPLSRETAT